MNDDAGAAYDAVELKRIIISGMEGEIPLNAGRALFILGRNGTGKSALVQTLNTQLRPNIIYLPGSRPSFFENEGLTMSNASRRQWDQNSPGWDSNPEIRYRPISGSTRNEKAVFDLHARETQYAHDAASDIKEHGRDSKLIEKLQLRVSPLDRANQLLEQGNLPTKLKIKDGELVAYRTADETYSIVKMSDGERSALILVSEVIAASAGSVFLIDEPELHLHRSIVVPLLLSLIAERQDCGFIISTHELSLPSEVEDAQALLVRGCRWDGTVVASWDVNLLPSIDEIPEDLRVDVLGSRQKILFVEGLKGSLDQPLYAILFPHVSVRPRANCREVQKAVKALRAIRSLHHIDAYGLVDNDSQTSEQIAKLAELNIYALDVYSVESLYYSEAVLEAVAARQAEESSQQPEAILTAAVASALSSIDQTEIQKLASIVCVQKMRQEIMSKAPTPQDLVANGEMDFSFAIPSTYPTEESRLVGHIKAGELDAIIRRYPVKRSKILKRVATGLGFKNVSEYEKVALTQIAAVKELADTLRAQLGDLANVLA